jgi:hypothetical protein
VLTSLAKLLIEKEVVSHGAMPITAESQVDETIKRYPSTGPIFLQRGRPYAAQRGPGLTLGEYATLGGLAIAPLLELLNAAAEAEQFAQQTSRSSRSEGDQSGWRERTTPIGSIGYTESYRERSGDVVDVSVVSVQEARGPE